MSVEESVFRLDPPGRIGVLGGGQLGRMMAKAAARLGFQLTIYCPEENCPAAQVAGRHFCYDYDNKEQLINFAKSVDVVTFEFENIPVTALEICAEYSQLAPGIKSQQVASDRLAEKRFIQAAGIDVAPFAPFTDAESLKDAFNIIDQRPGIAKTRFSGYDGKGQYAVKGRRDFDKVLEGLAGSSAVLEAKIDFDREVSVMVARDRKGNVAAFAASENTHIDGMLKETIIPAAISAALDAKARVIATRIANELGHVGVLAVEMFVVENGTKLLVNEIAPRVHNSGHWTIEGAKTSQFEQHIRAICGLPLGSVDSLGQARMLNLIGDEIIALDPFFCDPDARLHHYGKSEPRPGRKMGHVTWVNFKTQS